MDGEKKPNSILRRERQLRGWSQPHQMNQVRKLLRKLEKSPARNHPKVQNLNDLLYETLRSPSPSSPTLVRTLWQKSSRHSIAI